MLKQFGIIVGITYIGNFISKISGLPIPGTVIGMVLLFCLLYFGILKLSSVEGAANALIMNLAFIFIPPAVTLISKLDILKEFWSQILIITVTTTAITMAVTAYIADVLIRRRNK